MEQPASTEPYTDSGTFAAVQARKRLKTAALIARLTDADELEQRGRLLVARSRRMGFVAGGVLGAIILVSASLLFVCYHAYDGTVDGMLLGNWSMLGVLVSAGAANFAWGWVDQQRRAGQVGRKLVVRAIHQRARATQEAGKADDTE